MINWVCMVIMGCLSFAFDGCIFLRILFSFDTKSDVECLHEMPID